MPDAALALIARAAEGSMRDAQSALDQVMAFAGLTITVNDVATVMGLVGRDLLFEVIEAVIGRWLIGGSDRIEAPGQLASHYAPRKPLRLSATARDGDEWLIGFGPSAGDDTLTGGTEADSFSGGSGTDTATDLSAIEGDTQDGTIP